MTTRALRPWTDLVKLHPDVEAGVAHGGGLRHRPRRHRGGDPNVPVVNRDPEAFFRATYLTADLQKLLEEVLASLAGKSGYNRVLKLRTPFGGGSRTPWRRFCTQRGVAKLSIAFPKRSGFARPQNVAVAVFDGEKFDARNGKELDGGRTIRTMWGWLAWQIDPERAFPIVAQHDEDRVAPGGDVIRDVLTKGAGGRPVLILLDEVLKYMERAAAVAVLDSTLQRQAKDFFQNLTVEVAGSTNAALVYSLTWSAREALGQRRAARRDRQARRAGGSASRTGQRRRGASHSAASPARRSPGPHRRHGGRDSVSGSRDRHAEGPRGDARRTPAGRRRRPFAARPDAGRLSLPPRAHRHHAGKVDRR
ncbi:MAG: hypothetical protein KatS3mg052_2524 [Candidatus Roseilinea sp.]|nr:MAG: hypothetical protein KatS3mg052_2524 [Candidatus Roseilinea sp.]